MIRNNLSWINLNAGSSGGSGGGGVSDYNDLANRPIISMTGTSQNPLKLWNLSTGLYLLNGYVYYNTTNTRECVNLFVSITAQIQNGKYVLSAFVPSWEGHYEYIKANFTSTDYTDTQILKMLTEDDVLTLTNEVEYTPTTDYHPSTKKYVDEAMQSVIEEFAKMGINEQDIKTLIAENRRRDIAIQALLNETADKNVTIEEDTHTISLDYSMEDGMATVNSIEGSTLVNVSKTVDEVYITKSQDRVEQSKIANTIGEQNGKLCPIIEGDTLVNVCNQKEPIAITKSYTIENSGNHIALQGEYDGKCRPVIQGNTLVNLVKNGNVKKQVLVSNATLAKYSYSYKLKDSTDYTIVFNLEGLNSSDVEKFMVSINKGENGKVYPLVNGLNIIKYNSDTMTNTNAIWFYIQVGVTLSGTEDIFISDVMIFEGDLTQTPELIPTEYIEGLKSSFEDNVVTQAMVDSGEESAENLGKYKVEYKVTGKNKWKPIISPHYANGYKAVASYENNILTIKGTGDGISEGNSSPMYLSVKLKPNTNYYFSYKSDGTAGSANGIDTVEGFIHDNGLGTNNWIKCSVIPSGIAFNSGSGNVGFRFDVNKNNTTHTFYDFSLVEGEVATPYEPYKEYTKTFYLNSPLLEGDTIEDINGVATHVKRSGKVVLDGSEDEKWDYDSQWNVFILGEVITNGGYYIVNTDIKIINITWNGDNVIGVDCEKHNITSKEEGISLLQANPTTVVYELASPIYEPISTESILCDSYVNGHLDFDSAVPVEKVQFLDNYLRLRYIKTSTKYTLQFEADNEGHLDWFTLGDIHTTNKPISKGVNKFTITTNATDSPAFSLLYLGGIGFNASNIVVTEATDKDFDYFNGIQSTFEENLVTDENNPHYGKYRVIYRTKSSDGNASTVKSVYLNSPLLQGDKLVVVNGKLCHYHKMGKVVLDGSEDWTIKYNNTNSYGYALFFLEKTDINNVKLDGFCIADTIKCQGFNNNSVQEPLLCLSSGQPNNFAMSSSITKTSKFKQWLQANPTTVVYELASPYYEEISSNPKDTVVDFYANGTLEVQSAVYPLSMEFISFEEELTYLYASTVYTVQFEANGNAIANITLGGITVTNQEITHGINRIQVTTPSTLVDNKLIIDGCGDCKISKIVVTNSIEEFEYFEGMKSAFEDKQNEDGTYTVEIVVYNAPIRLNKDKE